MSDGWELVRFPELVTRASPRPLSDLVPVFLRQFRIVRGRSVATVRAYESDLTVFTEFCQRAGLTYPDQVRVQHLETFLGWLATVRGLQPSSVARYRHALRALWEWLEHEEIVTRNPAAKTYAPKQRKKLTRSLSIPQQDRLYATLACDHSPVGMRDYAIMSALGLAGLRASEVGRLKLEHLDLETGVLYVIEGKGGKDRTVPVLAPLDGILSGHLTQARPVLLGGRENPFVFISRNHGRSLGSRGIWRLVRRTIERANPWT